MKRHVFALICLSAASLVGCESGTQPVECDLFLTCFYPDSDDLSPDRLDGRPRSQETEDEALAAFGTQGECWRNGESDRFYTICRRTCVDILVDECRQEADQDRPCVVSDGAQNIFEPPEWESSAPAPTCQELENTQRELAGTEGA